MSDIEDKYIMNHIQKIKKDDSDDVNFDKLLKVV